MNIIQLEICGQINNLTKEDYLFVLCEKNLVIFTFDRYNLRYRFIYTYIYFYIILLFLYSY
jgi:hypothetical protein